MSITSFHAARRFAPLGLFGAAMIIVHAKGIVVGNSGGFFFIWTMFALSATGWVTMILSAHRLWMAFRARRSRVSPS